jgi:hypothetical protein
MSCNCSPYGNFRTRTFAEIFTQEGEDSVNIFTNDITNCGIPLKIREDSLTTLFYLLYARYGNSHISSSDENTFLYKLASTIFMYGPSWEKRVEIQDALRSLTEADLLKGSSAIYNTANAPGTSLADVTDEEGKVDYISGQNTTDYRKSKMEGFATLASLLETDVTKEFIDKFANLFLKIVQPYDPLWYVTEEVEN